MSKRSIPLSSKKSRQDCAADGRGVGYTGVVSSSERLGVLWGDVSDVDEPASEIGDMPANETKNCTDGGE